MTGEKSTQTTAAAIKNRLTMAAKTAITHPSTTKLAQWIGAGPSIRARGRLALAAAFLVAAPTLFIGVMRTSDVATYADSLGAYSYSIRTINRASAKIERVRTGIWRFETQPELENERILRRNVAALRKAVSEIVKSNPPGLDESTGRHLMRISQRINDAVERGLLGYTGKGKEERSLSLARLSLVSLGNDIKALDNKVGELADTKRIIAQAALSSVGRDQLILFLVLLFAIPIFVGFVPGWLVAPLMRLKGVGQRIEGGRLREIAVAGHDEVSNLTRTIKKALVRREVLDQKKSAKIFEIRNVLRSVLGKVDDAVLIIDGEGRINYANKPAADLIKTESHYLEGDHLSDFIIAPQLFSAISNALKGDVSAGPMKVSIELSNGIIYSLRAKMGVVHDREGEVSRVVVVLVIESEASSNG